MTPAKSELAREAMTLVGGLQDRFVRGLERVSATHGAEATFDTVAWQRDEGRHGGGNRRVAADTPVFGRASVNVSQVHYDDLPDKRLSSATALSTIIHPVLPTAPSVHIHVSFTELRDGKGYWRIMADLNPAIAEPEDTRAFAAALEEATGEHYARGSEQGDRYFYIPALERHRGVTHFYLEAFESGDFEADAALAEAVGRAAIDAYLSILDRRLGAAPALTDAHRREQLAYHTLYLFQVLTLDRGTTSGLLIHDQNDVGILGSLPRAVDRVLLASWRDRMPAPQGELLDRIVAVLDDASPSPVREAHKRALARAVRAHYTAHPEALRLQAAGDVVPPTVANHGSRA